MKLQEIKSSKTNVIDDLHKLRENQDFFISLVLIIEGNERKIEKKKVGSTFTYLFGIRWFHDLSEGVGSERLICDNQFMKDKKEEQNESRRLNYKQPFMHHSHVQPFLVRLTTMNEVEAVTTEMTTVVGTRKQIENDQKLQHRHT